MKTNFYLIIICLTVTFNSWSQCTEELNSPTLTNTIGGWENSGMQFVATVDCILTEVIFYSQGNADSIKLYDGVNQQLYSIFVPPGATFFTFNPDYPLSAGQTYRLIGEQPDNGHWESFSAYPVNNPHLSLEGVYSITSGTLSPTWWFHFTKIETSIQNVATGIDVVESCGDFVWIDGNNYTTDNNIATHTIVGGAVSGCDSIVTLDLTIIQNDNSVTQIGALLTANQSIGTYQWIDCNNGNASISGATNQSYTVTVNGNYAVVVTQGTCSDTSACFLVNWLTNEALFSSKFSVFPNPASDIITVLSDEVIESILIIDVTGKLVQTETKKTFSVENLPAGIYFLQIQTENGVEKTHIVKI